MEVAVPAARVSQEIDARLLRVSRTARINGFRPGKAPIHVVRQHYGAQVREEVLGELVRSSFADAVQQENLKPAGGPRIEPIDVEAGGDLKYAASFEVYPEILLVGTEGMELSRPVAEVSEADVDTMIESLRKQRPNWVSVTRACQDGDRLTVDFEGRIDGQVFEGGAGKGIVFPIGAGRMLTDFEAGLRGAAAGETRTFPLVFPADYGKAELAGRTAEFTVTLQKVEEPQLPEIDAEFCRAFGVDEGGVEALRAEVRSNMERELAQTVAVRMKMQVMDKLLAANPLDLPRVLLDAEIREMQLDTMRRMGAQNARQLPPRESFEQGARRRVALGLLINELVRAQGIEPDAARVEARLDELVLATGDPDAARQQYLQNEQALRQLQMMTIEDQVVDWLVGRAQVTEQRTTFRDLMNFGATI
jgi:trigger factor